MDIQENPEELKTTLYNALQQLVDDAGDLEECNPIPELTKIFAKSHSFRKEVASGIHGKTAQFWLSYVDAIALYHDISRSHRAGNFALLK